MDYKLLLHNIREAILKDPYDTNRYVDMLVAIKQSGLECTEDLYFIKNLAAKMLSKAEAGASRDFYDIYKNAAKVLARSKFDEYLQYVELDRKPEKRFYLPRRGYLKPIVDKYQKILDGEIQFLSVSMPKRSGKSQLGINFINMISGMRPDRSTLMEGTGDALVKSFYNGCSEYLVQPNEYLYHDIFPNAPVVQTNADMKTINLEAKSRFPTIMCRSIDSSQVGLSEATNVLYLDDLVDGREEAKNRQRLDDKWEVISGDVLGRAIEGTPIIVCGTRYSIYDPIGRLQEFARQQNWKWECVEIPALDPITDESNYEYVREGRKVFTSAYFREQRELLSAEQFESEFQQQPFEAKGLMFPKTELNYFEELPIDRSPDTIVAFCDTAESGADYTAMVILYIYGQDVYVPDVVFDNSPSDVTKPQCAKKLKDHYVVQADFESNNAGEYFARDVGQIVKEYGGRTNIRTRRTISNKRTRIEFASDGIKKHFHFLSPNKYERGGQYWEFMQQVTTYTRSGKVPHDDAPDVLSLAENGLRLLQDNVGRAVKRPF